MKRNISKIIIIAVMILGERQLRKCKDNNRPGGVLGKTGITCM